MASPSYGIDVVALAFAVVLAAVLALLISPRAAACGIDTLGRAERSP